MRNLKQILSNFLWLFVWNKSKRSHLKRFLRLSYGENNKIVIISNGKRTEHSYYFVNGLVVDFQGDNNVIEIDASTIFKNCYILMNTNNSVIKIGPNSHYTNTNFYMHHGDNMKAELGKNINSNGFKVDVIENGSSFKVGDFCLFSNSISIWTSDGHSIFDKNTKEIINFNNKGVEIGEHCWIGEGVKLVKNASLAKNTVVGIGSIVTKPFTEENVIIAGNPAKIIRRDIDWSAKLCDTKP